jgi:hypothetical protein
MLLLLNKIFKIQHILKQELPSREFNDTRIYCRVLIAPGNGKCAPARFALFPWVLNLDSDKKCCVNELIAGSTHNLGT